MEDNDLINGQPFDDPKERQRIRTSADRADKTWLIIGPLHAVVSNWRALAVILALIAWFNRPEIANAVAVLIGAGK